LIYGAYSFIGVGVGNECQASASLISGGSYNRISETSDTSCIVGGSANRIDHGGDDSFIGGGNYNLITNCNNNITIVGGYANTITNTATGAFIGGGTGGETANNVIANSDNGFIGGGSYNQVVNATYGIIPGGLSNSITAEMGIAVGNLLAVTNVGEVQAGYYTNALTVQSNGWVQSKGLTIKGPSMNQSGFGGFRLATNTIVLVGLPDESYNGVYTWTLGAGTSVTNYYANALGTRFFYYSPGNSIWFADDDTDESGATYNLPNVGTFPIGVLADGSLAEVGSVVPIGALTVASGVMVNNGKFWLSFNGATNSMNYPNGSIATENDGLWVLEGGIWTHK
jgi:hypothetical protein